MGVEDEGGTGSEGRADQSPGHTISTEDSQHRGRGLCILGASSLPGSFTCPFGRLEPLMTLVTFAGVSFPESCCRGSRVARCGPGPFCHPEKVLGELQAQPHHWPEAAGLQLPAPSETPSKLQRRGQKMVSRASSVLLLHLLAVDRR